MKLGRYSTMERLTASQKGHLILVDLNTIETHQSIGLLFLVEIQVFVFFLVLENVSRWRDLSIRNHRRICQLFSLDLLLRRLRLNLNSSWRHFYLIRIRVALLDLSIFHIYKSTRPI